MAKEKVDWRHEYRLDNICNIVTGIMAIAILFIDVSPMLVILPIGCALFINLSASQFFTKKYY